MRGARWPPDGKTASLEDRQPFRAVRQFLGRRKLLDLATLRWKQQISELKLRASSPNLASGELLGNFRGTDSTWSSSRVAASYPK